MKTTIIPATEADVKQVATQLKMNPTPEEIQEVIKRYPAEAEQDPTGTWDLIVENVLYQVLGEREICLTEGCKATAQQNYRLCPKHLREAHEAGFDDSNK